MRGKYFNKIINNEKIYMHKKIIYIKKFDQVGYRACVPGPRQQAQVLGQHAWNPNIKKKKN
jgi:hypothetical protein